MGIIDGGGTGDGTGEIPRRLNSLLGDPVPDPGEELRLKARIFLDGVGLPLGGAWTDVGAAMSLFALAEERDELLGLGTTVVVTTEGDVVTRAAAYDIVTNRPQPWTDQNGGTV